MEPKQCKSGEKNKRSEVLQCVSTHLEKRLKPLEEEFVDLQFQLSEDARWQRFKKSKHYLSDCQRNYSNAHCIGFNIFKDYMKKIQPDENWDEVNPSVVHATLGR